MLVSKNILIEGEYSTLIYNATKTRDFHDSCQISKILNRSTTPESTPIYHTSNHDSFDLWWTQSLAKYQKVSKCYVHASSQFLFRFTFLKTTVIVKNSSILAAVYFI